MIPFIFKTRAGKSIETEYRLVAVWGCGTVVVEGLRKKGPRGFHR